MDSLTQLQEKLIARIDKSKTILLSCHINPDGDSIGSNLAMFLYLKTLGKKVRVISPDPIPKKFEFLSGVKEIEQNIDIATINRSDVDLFLGLDFGGWQMVSRTSKMDDLEKEMANIDHHATNNIDAALKIVLTDKGSTSEILYDIFKKLKISITHDIAQNLYLGIYTDTGGLSFPNTTSSAMVASADLLELGADFQKTMVNMERNTPLGAVRYWGAVLNNMQINKELRYVWSVVSAETIRKLGVDESELTGAANRFLPIVEGTDFGFLITERSRGIDCSFRGKALGVDTAIIAQFLGGGGHKLASGCRAPEGMNLTDFEKLIHQTIKENIQKILPK